ncbi:hypothetical protein K3495_g1118 [Podosphaera aphanis]|nr:hypothetical protein K3495_g1118 [Podosphaera aphanis]
MVLHEIKCTDDFDSALKDHEMVIFVAFAKWCGSSIIMLPLIETFSEEYQDIYFNKVDIDVVPALARRLDTHTLPTMIIYKKGENTKQIMGAQPQVLLTAIREALGKPTHSA